MTGREKGRRTLRYWTDFLGITRQSKRPLLPSVVYIVLGAILLLLGAFNLAIGSGSQQIEGLVMLLILAPLMFLLARRR